MKPKEFYKTKAWKYCSRYILLFYSDGLLTQCFTCGLILQINQANCHCGHLIKLTDAWATAFEFTNLGVQCMQCNRFHGGRQDLMKDKLISIHGVGAIEKLYIQKHNYCKIDKFTLDYYEKLYKDLFDDLVKQKGNPWK